MGGSARDWSIVLREDLRSGGALDLRLVMTKFGVPAVTIAYEIRLEDA